MANSYSTQDLVKGALQKCGETTDGSSQFHGLALKYVNNVYGQLLSGSNIFAPEIGRAWTWARSSAVLTLLPAYSTGSVTMTNGSVNGTFSSAPALSQVGRFFKIDNEPTYYKVATHTAAATAFTLDAAFIGTSGAGLTFKSLPLLYDLGGSVLRLVEPFRITADRCLENLEMEADQGQIGGIEIDKFRELFPVRGVSEGVPTRFTTVSRSESAWTVQFNKYVTESTRVDYDKIAIQADLVDSGDSVPLIPREYRTVLEYGASYFLLTDKGTLEKATTYFNLTRGQITAMDMAETKNTSSLSKNYARLTPRRDQASNNLQRGG